jgi:serine/threonine protein kinase
MFDYKFIRRLGQGSFGVVYEAENVRDGKRYAVKV